MFVDNIFYKITKSLPLKNVYVYVLYRDNEAI